VEFVRNLLSLRSAFPCGCRILSSSVTADDIYFWVGKQPSCKCFLFAICKEFYWLTKLKIYKDCAEEIWTGNASLRRQPEFPRREHAHDVETHSLLKNS